MIRARGLAFVLPALLSAAGAAAESHFLSKQYSRCQACHFSPTGGGLLTPYGRSLSAQEISTWGRSPEGEEEAEGKAREEEFLFGLLGRKLGPLSLGIDLRPTRLEFDSSTGSASDRSLWMRADLQAGAQLGKWTLYGEVGRIPELEGPAPGSYEYWAMYTAESGTGVRFGRFLPGFGLRYADHTAYNRRGIGFDRDDQVFGVELSDVGERHLIQFAASPGLAEDILDDTGRRAPIFTGRLQLDLANRHVLVLSGMYRGAPGADDPSWFGGVAYGWSPHPRLALWTELVERVSKGWDGTPEYTVFHETAFEVHRGVWLKFSPQLQTELNNVSGGLFRTAFSLQLFPRPHWNLNLSWYRDRVRQQDGLDFDTLILQLHVYL